MDELEGVVSRLKIDSAPGPDNIFSKLLINADKTVLDFLLQIFIKSWKEGYLGNDHLTWKGGGYGFFLKKYSDSQCCWKKYSDFCGGKKK